MHHQGNDELLMADEMNILPTVFKGESKEIGIAYGKAFASNVRLNLSALVWSEVNASQMQESDFHKWVLEQESLVASNWPWLLEEMDGVAESVGVGYAGCIQY